MGVAARAVRVMNPAPNAIPVRGNVPASPVVRANNAGWMAVVNPAACVWTARNATPRVNVSVWPIALEKSAATMAVAEAVAAARMRGRFVTRPWVNASVFRRASTSPVAWTVAGIRAVRALKIKAAAPMGNAVATPNAAPRSAV